MTPQELWQMRHIPDTWENAPPQVQADWLTSYSHGFDEGAQLSQLLNERITRLQNENLALLRENIAQREKIVRLDNTTDDLLEKIEDLIDRNEELLGENIELRSKIAELEAKLAEGGK
jgi:chromosome segregation ATPase